MYLFVCISEERERVKCLHSYYDCFWCCAPPHNIWVSVKLGYTGHVSFGATLHSILHGYALLTTILCAQIIFVWRVKWSKSADFDVPGPDVA